MQHQTLLIICLIFASTTQAAWQSPETVAGSTAIDTNEAMGRLDSGVPFIDVRDLRLYNKRHIPGAYHLELKNDFTPENLAKIIKQDEPAVIYCNGTHCSLSYKAVTKAVQWGFTNILYYREGMKVWRRSNNPVESVTE